MRDVSIFKGSNFILPNILWNRPVEEQYPHSSILLYVTSFISMFTVTKVSFLLFCENKCGCFNRVWHDSVLEAEQTGNVKTKAQSAHLACVSLSACWLGSGNMAQCTFTFVGGRAKCAGRVLEPHGFFFFFSDVTPLPCVSARYVLKSLWLFACLAFPH